MSELDETPDDPPRDPRRRFLLLTAGAAVVVGLLAWWLLTPAPSRPVEPRPAEPPSAPRSEVAAPAPTPEPPPAETPRDPRPRRRPAPTPAGPASPAPTAPAAPVRALTIDSDVPGALVFLDRKFLGNAPVTITDIAAGAHQVNVSAEGFDGVARAIEVAESGPTTVTVSLRDVRLDEAVDVVHKHRMGSCQGRLTAGLSGFRFTPTRGDDGFVVPLSAVDEFEVDYLKKNLRLRNKAGKTWNFESPTGSADPLFVFHREVEKARTKLAARP